MFTFTEKRQRYAFLQLHKAENATLFLFGDIPFAEYHPQLLTPHPSLLTPHSFKTTAPHTHSLSAEVPHGHFPAGRSSPYQAALRSAYVS